MDARRVLCVGEVFAGRYELLDPILRMYVEEDRTAAEIVQLGHPEDVVRRIFEYLPVP